MGINWTPDQKSIVAEKLKEGWGSRAIGELFDRSKNAVIGLVGRDPELKEIGFAREGLGGRKKEGRPVAPRRQTLNPATARPLPRPSRHEDEKQLAGVPMFMLGAHQCRFAVNDAEVGEMHLFCGLPADGSYCDHHASRVRKHLDRET